MLKGRFHDDDEKRDESLMPDRLIHYEPDDESGETKDDSASVFGTYYKAISADPDDNTEKVLFANDESEDAPDASGAPITPESIEPEYSPVVFQKTEEEHQDVMDKSFPLFLSFKASDSAQSISEVLREKSAKTNDSPDESKDQILANEPDSAVNSDSVSDPTSNEVFEDDIDTSDDQELSFTAPPEYDPAPMDAIDYEENDPFDIALDELNVPVFKPFQAAPPQKETDSYDIPEVFNDRKDDEFLPENDEDTDQIASDDQGQNTRPFEELTYSEEPDAPEIKDPAIVPAIEVLTDPETIDDSDEAIEVSLSDEESGSELSGTEPESDFDSEPLKSDQSTQSTSGKKYFDAFEYSDVTEIETLDTDEETQTNHLLAGSIIDTQESPESPSVEYDIPNRFFDESTVSEPDPSLTPDDSSEGISVDTLSSRADAPPEHDDSLAAVLRDEGINVFADSNSEKQSGNIPVRSRAEAKERPGRQYSEKKEDPAAKSAPVKGVQPLNNLDRPGSKYTAAQQMGTITPQKERYRVSKRKAAEYLPLVIILILIALSVAFYFIWTSFNLGDVFSGLFGKSGNDQGVVTYPVTSITTFEVTPSDTTLEPTATTAAATETVTPTPANTPTPTATPTPTPSPTATPTPTSTPTPSPSPTPGVVTRFRSKIINGDTDGSVASFDLELENSGGKDSTLYDSIKQITITYSASVTFDSVSSSGFTFVKKEGSKNTFIGTPTSMELIKSGDVVLVDISATTSSSSVGSFKIESYYIEYNS
ncbi:MAG: hypothetical protein JW817_03730 [Clostridiales bacterium]|nr:hypothetical protein [Clostridiales bacterium]